MEETVGAGTFDGEARSRLEQVGTAFKLVVVAQFVEVEALPGTKVIVVFRPGIPKEDDKEVADIVADCEDAAET